MRNNNPRWNKYEAALLLEALLKIKEGKCSTKELVSEISNRLRRKAILDNLEVSETYRNVNGITLQLAAMEFAYTNGVRGVKNVSKLFYEIVELYKTQPQEFRELSRCAREKYPE